MFLSVPLRMPISIAIYGSFTLALLLGIGVVNRPSTVAGQRYDDVDHAYIRAVRSVLTGKTRAPEAATELEKELVGITGFKTGPPSPIQSPKHRTAERVR